MDKYAENEKLLWNLHKKIVNDIKDALAEKGYGVGDKVFGETVTFDILNDRLLINVYHTDNLSADELLKALHDAMTVIPK